MDLFTIISAKNILAPLPEKSCFSTIYEIIRCFSACISALAKHICLSIEIFLKTCFAMSYWISKKRLKIDNFECGISEHFPIAYDGIQMKFLNLELFSSKALTFPCIF